MPKKSQISEKYQKTQQLPASRGRKPKVSKRADAGFSRPVATGILPRASTPNDGGVGKTVKNQKNRRFSAHPDVLEFSNDNKVLEGMLKVRQVVVDEGHAGQRLDNFLLGLLKGVPKTYVYRIIRSGEVRLNKGRVDAHTRIALDDVIRIPPVRLPQRPLAAAPTPAREFPVIYEDECLLVINKPAGVAVHGGSGVSYGVIEQLRQARPGCKMLELVHRLDRETSGVLVIAKKRQALTFLQDQFRDRKTGKVYLALVKGVWRECGVGKKRVIDVALHKYLTAQGERRVRVTGADDPLGKRSVTVVQPVEVLRGCSLFSVAIKTGRTHQIRVHLAHLGYPIIGDDKYGDFDLNRDFVKGYGFDRMFLHAYRLSVVHPQTGEALDLNAPLPLECRTLLEELKNETITTTPI